MSISEKDIRATLLQIVADQEKLRSGGPASGSLQQNSILGEASRRLGDRLSLQEEQALLTAWYDLFRSGHLSWGYNLNNPDPPFCHTTEQGRRTLAQISRDPSNPDGYMAHLNSVVTLNPIAASYIDEALGTYNTNRFKATAVMVGAAAESLVLELRDAIAALMAAKGSAAPKAFGDFRIKQVLEAVRKELDMRRSAMPNDLREQVDAYWPAFVQQIRAARNDAGHPASIDPVTSETVHASLLIYPELAALALRLRWWAAEHYK